MTNEELEFFKNELIKRESQIKDNLTGTMDRMSEMRSQEMNDDADLATVAITTDINAAIVDQQSKELAEIELALDKIKNGTYGICEICEDDINIERLKVKNFARYCITCREITEKEHH